MFGMASATHRQQPPRASRPSIEPRYAKEHNQNKRPKDQADGKRDEATAIERHDDDRIQSNRRASIGQGTYPLALSSYTTPPGLALVDRNSVCQFAIGLNLHFLEFDR